MAELVHELDLLEHVVPVGPVLVHLQHHDLPGGLVGNLKGKERLRESYTHNTRTIKAGVGKL